MKVHSTNYQNTLIEIAEDCPATSGEIPPLKGQNKSVAMLQFEILNEHPYTYTSDDVLFSVFAMRRKYAQSEWDERRKEYFSKGQACFRASPLPKRYGFGIHSDENGKIAVYGVETKEYQRLVDDPTIQKLKALRSKKA